MRVILTTLEDAPNTARDLMTGLILARQLELDLAVLDVNPAGLTSAKIADLSFT